MTSYWLVVNKGMYTVEYFCSNKSSLCQSISRWSYECYKAEVNLATLGFFLVIAELRQWCMSVSLATDVCEALHCMVHKVIL